MNELVTFLRRRPDAVARLLELHVATSIADIEAELAPPVHGSWDR